MRMASRMKKSQYAPVVLPALIGVAGLLLGSLLTHWLGTAREKEATAQTARSERLTFYQTVRVHLEASDSAFDNQAALRDRLVKSLADRYGSEDMEYEPLFREYYSKKCRGRQALPSRIRGQDSANRYRTSE